MVAGVGAVWGVNVMTQNFTGLVNINVPRGPIETCALGLLIWLHAKWRVSVKAQ